MSDATRICQIRCVKHRTRHLPNTCRLIPVFYHSTISFWRPRLPWSPSWCNLSTNEKSAGINAHIRFSFCKWNATSLEGLNGRQASTYIWSFRDPVVAAREQQQKCVLRSIIYLDRYICAKGMQRNLFFPSAKTFRMSLVTRPTYTIRGSCKKKISTMRSSL